MRFQIFEPYHHTLFCEVSNRYGGVSSLPYESLNLALHVGDNPINVLKNRSHLAQEYNFYIENLIYMEQTHSNNITVIDHTATNKIDNCDAVITNQSNIPLMVMVADCIPILMYDPIHQVIAAVHAGRNGTFKEIASKTIQKMHVAFGSKPKDIKVALGPSIHRCCYQVGAEIAQITKQNFGEKYIHSLAQKQYLDLQSLNFDQLTKIGVEPNNIEVSPQCSCCDETYFSYRREGITGRFAGIIKLR